MNEDYFTINPEPKDIQYKFFYVPQNMAQLNNYINVKIGKQERKFQIVYRFAKEPDEKTKKRVLNKFIKSTQITKENDE